MASTTAQNEDRGDVFRGSRLSLKLLLLTLASILFVEVLVYLPSIAKFRRDFLTQRMAAAQVAALSLSETEKASVSEELERTLLSSAGVSAVVLDLGERRSLNLQSDLADEIAARYTLESASALQLIGDAMETLLRGGDAVIEVQGRPTGLNGMSLSIVLHEEALFQAMLRYTRNIFFISLLIAIVTAGLVYLSLYRSIVRPIHRVMASMIAFRQRPDDPKSALVPSERQDEIGMAERELARMQDDLRQALGQRRRLAMLGQAVSKVNHDLRNILSTAQLSSDRLATVDDPAVKSASERMVRAIDRAIGLCERTLKYGRSDEPMPEKKDLAIGPLLDDVISSLNSSNKVAWEKSLDPDLTVYADPEQLFRILLNLARNSALCLEGQENGGTITFSAAPDGNNGLFIRIADTGPGLPKKAKDNLFVPFASTTAKGGTGLGLTIVHELMVAHGGEASLEKSNESGTTFRLWFPAN